MPLPLIVKELTNVTGLNSVIPDELVFYAGSSSTVLGDWGLSTTTYTSLASAPSGVHLSVEVATLTDDYSVVEMTYTDVDGTAHVISNINYRDIVGTRMYFDTHGYLYLDEAMTVAVVKLQTIEQGISITNPEASMVFDGHIIDGDTITVSNEVTSSMITTISQKITIGQIQLKQLMFDIINKVNIKQSIGFNDTDIIVAEQIQLLELVTKYENTVLEIGDLIKLLHSCIDYVRVQSIDRNNTASSTATTVDTSTTAYVLLEQQIITEQETLTKLLNDIKQAVIVSQALFPPLPLYNTEFAVIGTDIFDAENESYKIFVGAKLTGSLPEGTYAKCYFLTDSGWYSTEYKQMLKQNQFYFNVQGKAFKIEFKVPLRLKYNISVFEFMWKQTDNTHMRSSYYYGS